MTVTIHHNPARGTSRNVLGLTRDSGAEPAVVEYLHRGAPTKEDGEPVVDASGRRPTKGEAA